MRLVRKGSVGINCLANLIVMVSGEKIWKGKKRGKVEDLEESVSRILRGAKS